MGASKTIAWPSVAIQTPKNSGVASSIKSTPYSIGYVELAYALQNNFTFAAVKNAAGVYVVPSAATVAADADQKLAVTPTDFSIVNQPGAGSYPIAGLQLGHPAAEAEEHHHRAPRWSRSSTGPPTPAVARTRLRAGLRRAPAGAPELEPDHTADGDGPERAGTADQVRLRGPRPTDHEGLTEDCDQRRDSGTRGREARSGATRLPNGAYRALLIVAAAIFVGLVAWYLVSIVVQAKPAFSTLGFSWIFEKVWNPNRNKYGLLPFILGTIETTAIALVLAVPIGLGTAIALAHLVPDRLRPPLSTAVELLAAVPSVVYGLWGLIVLAPVFRSTVEPFLTSVLGWTGLFNGPDDGVGVLLAGVILFVMVLPTMVAISRDVLAVVPKEQIEGAQALGRHPVAGAAQGGGTRAPAPASSAPSPWPWAGRWVRRWPWPWSSATRPTSPTRSRRRRPRWPR